MQPNLSNNRKRADYPDQLMFRGWLTRLDKMKNNQGQIQLSQDWPSSKLVAVLTSLTPMQVDGPGGRSSCESVNLSCSSIAQPPPVSAADV